MFKKLAEKDVGERLQKIIAQYKLSGVLSVAQVKGWIFNDYGDSASEASNNFQKKFFHCFKDIKVITDIKTKEFDEILRVSTDAWNVFPHRSLGGKSPQQMVAAEIKKESSPEKLSDSRMPKVIVGGSEMSYDGYTAMLKEMGRRQKPFKRQVEKEILPSYKEFLSQEEKLSKKEAEEHFRVVEIFFERAFWVGFLRFEAIRPEFATYEFPHWWQNHVLFHDRDENEILSSLKMFLCFMKTKFGRELNGREI
ncbi:hypothetical protein KJ591_01670 [Patescibacteria group bacterium]|nr:hypothetical protein [Patescibacteria group bacterium]MBU4023053.1 hypothetical protein [Patescibacteria group bacterium]